MRHALVKEMIVSLVSGRVRCLRWSDGSLLTSSIASLSPVYLVSHNIDHMTLEKNVHILAE